MNAPALSEWTAANRKYVAAELAWLRALLGEGDVAEAEAEVARRRALMPTPPAIEALAGLFGLSRFERDLLLLAAGVEMNARLAELCARGGRGLTFGLALATLPDAHWSALAPVEPLRRWRLVEPEEAQPFLRLTVRAEPVPAVLLRGRRLARPARAPPSPEYGPRPLDQTLSLQFCAEQPAPGLHEFLRA